MVVVIWRGEVKILLVATDYPPRRGGIATYGLQLAKALSAENEVTVLAPGPEWEGDAIQSFVCLRASVVTMRLAWLLKTCHFDVVLHTTWPTALISYLMLKIAPTPYFITAHASEILDDRRTWRRRLKSLLRPLKSRSLLQASGLFPVSRYTAGILQQMGMPASRIRVINNGVDVQYFTPAVKNAFFSPPRLLTVARLDKHKGHETVLRAMAGLIARGVPVSYSIVGDGDERAALQQLADTLGIRNSVHFLGMVADAALPDIYAGSDIFIMLSKELPGRLDLIEGFGISFLEASAAGLPVIAGRSGGVPDAVQDGVTGVLVDPDDVVQVEHALTGMLDHMPEAIEMGCQGRRWVEQEMSWGNVASRVVRAMKEMTAL